MTLFKITGKMPMCVMLLQNDVQHDSTLQIKTKHDEIQQNDTLHKVILWDVPIKKSWLNLFIIFCKLGCFRVMEKIFLAVKLSRLKKDKVNLLKNVYRMASYFTWRYK
jgi:hypothetical protein